MSNNEYYFLDPAEFLGMAMGGKMTHPVFGNLADRWEEETTVKPQLKTVMDLPGYTTDHRTIKFLDSMEPPLRLVRILLDDGSSKTFMLGEGGIRDSILDENAPKLSDGESRGVLFDTMTLYGAFRKATGFNLSQAARTCAHHSCRFFDDNYCNCYPLIPEDHLDCRFSARMDRLAEMMQKVGGGLK